MILASVPVKGGGSAVGKWCFFYFICRLGPLGPTTKSWFIILKKEKNGSARFPTHFSDKDWNWGGGVGYHNRVLHSLQTFLFVKLFPGLIPFQETLATIEFDCKWKSKTARFPAKFIQVATELTPTHLFWRGFCLFHVKSRSFPELSKKQEQVAAQNQTLWQCTFSCSWTRICYLPPSLPFGIVLLFCLLFFKLPNICWSAHSQKHKYKAIRNTGFFAGKYLM